VDTKIAKKVGIPVIEVPSISDVSVAEHTLMLMLALVKKFPKACQETREGQYRLGIKTILTSQEKYVYNWIGLDGFGSPYGKVLGIVGLGVIGQQVAKLARAFEMEVLYTKRHRLSKSEEKRLALTFVSFDELLRGSDFVSLHLRFYEETEKIMGEREFALMKPTAYLINTARGRLVDEEALYEALKGRKIAGAGLDVSWEEPLPRESQLWKLENVVITPHVAAIPDAVACRAEARQAAANILKYS
jgi:phosphoglycerate dehydrogenase-like enzyme